MSIPSRVGATEFRANCLQIIDNIAVTRQPVTITKRGRPVATLNPIEQPAKTPFFGAMAGSVTGFDDPFSPVVEEEEWNVLNSAD